MHFEPPLLTGTLVRRYKRFLADVDFGGSIETVHCPNPGAMTGLDAPGARVYVSKSGNPKRKLPLTLEIVEADDTLVGINTGLPNKLAEEAIEAGTIPQLADYDTLRREVRYGENSRIDLLLTREGTADCFVEIKNVHLCRTRRVMEFPDSTTKRGAKHLVELARQAESGARAVMLYVVQRDDGDTFRLARDIDPGYAAAFDEARAVGVEMLAWACRVRKTGIRIDRPLPVDE